ncbi:hypothetical protein A2841_00335 [Candidatus Kaiserbacteria bacterium RIFCSPHIGHO2_01_FULL_48_10]|uniref:Glycosyl transferase family 1 domain-containing protein n=1 Tax=Candidatus Kaiserbacteria bacterium RIFCSPHIGHO2_01_FULL_48_10 TaxID=1798476 RepID=A0A1F6C2H3_9BACT|nr:MAG: hypothetical protein A2841_00335 [Candidatus Kaiserbacteria bacterium RIFCSPHIGHO2_01_FULL_48_10]
MKTYAFVIPSAFRVNAILRTGIRTRLEKEPNTNILIISPFAEDDAFRKEFPNALHESLPKIPLRFVRRIARARELLLTVDKKVFVKSRLIEKSVMARRAVHALPWQDNVLTFFRTVLYPLRPALAWLCNKIEERLFYFPSLFQVIEKHHPTGLVMGTMTEPDDIVWLALARRYNIPAHVVDFPWSYIENRLWAVPRPAHIYLWSEMMREELLSNFPFPKEKTHITGCARYDWYATTFPTIAKEEFFRRIGADPSHHLIAYFIGTPYWNPHEHDTARLLLEMIEKGELPKNTQLVARLGWKLAPSDPFLTLKEQYPNFIIQSADDLPHQEYPSHLVYYSDLSLSTFSSLALDAAVLDRPHIFTALSGFDALHPDDAATARIFEYEFVKNALATEGVKVSYTLKDFKSLITSAVSNPSQGATGRKALAQKFLGTIDGKAGERIAQSIIALNA